MLPIPRGSVSVVPNTALDLLLSKSITMEFNIVSDHLIELRNQLDELQAEIREEMRKPDCNARLLGELRVERDRLDALAQAEQDRVDQIEGRRLEEVERMRLNGEQPPLPDMPAGAMEYKDLKAGAAEWHALVHWQYQPYCILVFFELLTSTDPQLVLITTRGILFTHCSFHNILSTSSDPRFLLCARSILGPKFDMPCIAVSGRAGGGIGCPARLHRNSQQQQPVVEAWLSRKFWPESLFRAGNLVHCWLWRSYADDAHVRVGKHARFCYVSKCVRCAAANDQSVDRHSVLLFLCLHTRTEASICVHARLRMRVQTSRSMRLHAHAHVHEYAYAWPCMDDIFIYGRRRPWPWYIRRYQFEHVHAYDHMYAAIAIGLIYI